jgi:polyisoprenoid-binding protein YceI
LSHKAVTPNICLRYFCMISNEAMTKIKLLTIAVILTVSCCAYIHLPNQQWTIEPGVSIRFNGKFADGTFDKLSGTIVFDPTNVTASHMDVKVDVSSINTGKALKNKHALGEHWFDTEKFPEIRFVSSEITRTDSSYTVRGELELHGIKKEIEIPFTFQNENGKALFQGGFRVNRAEYGIGKATGKGSDYTSIEIMVPVIGI